MNNRLEQKLISKIENSNSDSNMNIIKTNRKISGIVYDPNDYHISVICLRKLDKFYRKIKKKLNKKFDHKWEFGDYILLDWLDDPELAENFEIFQKDIRKSMKSSEEYLEAICLTYAL